MDAIFPSTEDVSARLDLGSQFYYISGLHLTAGFYCRKSAHIKHSPSYPRDWHHGVFSFHCHGQNISERRTDLSTESLSLKISKANGPFLKRWLQGQIQLCNYSRISTFIYSV